MKLELILGRAGYGKTYRCLSEIQSLLAENPEGHPLILIVPEQATFAVEKLLAQSSPSLGFMRVFVVGFRRLAYRVLSQTGGCARPHINEIGKRLVISRILAENKNKLKILGQMPKETALPPLLSGIIKDFKNYGISYENLHELLRKETVTEETTPLGKKISDLSLIYKKFDEFLKDRYTDPEDYTKFLTEKIPESALIKNAAVFIDGFSWFTPQEYDAIEALVKTATSVKVTLCLADPKEQVHELKESLFNSQWQTRNRLLSLASKLNFPVTEKELTMPCRFSERPLLARIEKNFDYNFSALHNLARQKPPIPNSVPSGLAPSSTRHFASPQNSLASNEPALTIAEAFNQTVEAEIIAREILRLSRECGLRFKDMAVILRNAENYQELIETTLTDYEIPFFSDSTRTVVHHPLAELLRSVLDIVLEKWSYEPIFRALKTDFFNLSRDEADILENYVLEFGIWGNRWLDNKPWTFYRPYSLDKENLLEDQSRRSSKEEFLTQINDIRFRATPELAEFSNKISRTMPAETFVHALYELTVRLNIPGILDKWTAAAETSGDLEQAKEHRQIWQAVIDLLDQIVETFKEQILTLDVFAALISEGLENLSLSLIPPGLDYVTITDVRRTKLLNIKAAFVPGVNDGIFPARYMDTGLINDSDREILRTAGIELPGGINNELFAEKFLIYTALTRASHYLWVSYALSDSSGKAALPSFIIKRLKEISGVTITHYPPQPPSGREAEYISTPAKTMSLLSTALCSYKEAKTINIDQPWRDVYNWAIKNDTGQKAHSKFLAGLFHTNKSDSLDKQLTTALFCSNRPVLRGSATRFESFRSCPFQHLAKYGLRLKDRPVYKLKAPDMGQFLHAIMKNFGNKIEEHEQKWADLTHEQAISMISQIAKELAPFLQNEILTSSSQYTRTFKTLEKKAVRSICRLIDFAKNSNFEPWALEKPFGYGLNALPPLAFNISGGNRLEVSGQIDRIDTLEQHGKMYALIIDYKSGGTNLSLNEVFQGLKLQLITYLLAVCSHNSILPAGAVYCYLKNPVITANTLPAPEKITAKINNALKMPGWLLADWEIVKQLDGSLPGYSDFFKIGTTTAGIFYEKYSNSLKSQTEFESLLTFAANELKAVGESILTGKTSIYPARLKNFSACTYCQYQAVCQFDRYLDNNNYNMLPNFTDKDVLARLK